MPIPLFSLLLGGLFVTSCVVPFLEEISGIVAEWLRRNNLQESWLMETLIFLTKVGVRIRRMIVVKSKNSTSHTVEEKIMAPEKIEDPDVRAKLEKEGKCVLRMDHLG